MTQAQFFRQAQMLTIPSDFEANSFLLDIVEPEHYEDFLQCLFRISGSQIRPAFKALDLVLYVSRKLHIETGVVFDKIPELAESGAAYGDPVKFAAAALH